jgi:RHS repeat-associated protein
MPLSSVRGALCLALAAASLAHAQSITPTYEEQYKLMRAPNAVAKVGTDMFGDSINLYNGKLEFTQTDVSLPGNNALPVAVGRRIAVGEHPMEGKAFGRWELDLPHIYGIVPRSVGWQSSASDNARCSSFGVPGTVLGGGKSVWEKSEYWQGAFVYVPGHGAQEMLVRQANNKAAPGPVAQYPVVTTKFWNFSCLPSVKGDTTAGTAGEGFLAIAPDGTKYYFDWAARFPARTLSKSNDTAGLTMPAPPVATPAQGTPLPPTPDAAGTKVTLLRNEIWLMPSKVVDRFGNSVTYTYDAQKPRNLTRIEASDGRVVTIGYVGDGHGMDQISSVSDGSRTWTYSYHTADVDGATVSNLDRVTLPDGSTWDLSGFDSLLAAIKTTNSGGCDDRPALASSTVSGTIVHPTGATASFTLAPTVHGRSRVNRACNEAGGGALVVPRFFASMSATAKTISGPGLSPMSWTYDYGSPNESWDSCTDCTTVKTVTVTDPASKETRLAYGNAFNINEGRLLATETLDGGAVLRSVTERYHDDAQDRYESVAGYSTIDDVGDNIIGTRLAPVDQRATSQQGVTMTWQANDFDAFARPVSVTRSSTLGPERTETTAYFDHTSKWILAQIKTVSESGTGKVMVRNTYDEDTATLKSVKHFERLDQAMTYNADGTLATRKDGKSNATAFGNYKRGIPQSVTYADNTSESAVVDNIGKITSLTNAAGSTTTFEYDTIGRLTAVNYPGKDSVSWHSTKLNFSRSDSARFGLPAGHWRQTVSTGEARSTNYFDAMWRPIFTETWDNADPTNTMRIVQHQYDHAGRTVFDSLPKRSYAELGPGTHTWYDALGRTTRVWNESELGNLTTLMDYGAGFTKTVTDPRSHANTYSYQIFDEPSEAAITSIDAPEDVHVAIARDVFGKTRSITRSGGGKSATHNYVYDDVEDLCKTIEPETAATIQQHDAAGNVLWRASGLGLKSTGSCNTAAVADNKKTTFGYDKLNRLTSTKFGDGSPSIIRSYTADGLPDTISSNGSVWTNTYNKRSLNERERLTYGDKTYDIVRSYDANGSLAQMKYPDANFVLDYAPNALGQATKVGSYASSITYHPNGAIDSFTYGNGIAHTTIQNLRGLPETSFEPGVLNERYAYDQNANVASIADDLQKITNRDMVYDGLNRLTLVKAPQMWGSAGYTYDALDNLTSVVIEDGATARATTHTFDAATNRLTSIANGPPGYNFSYKYDAQGNITQRGSQAYVFDMGNRMKSATGKETYGYDGLGHRFTVVGADGVNKLQLYSQEGQLLYVAPTGQPGTKYVYLDRHVIAEVSSAGTVYDHTDALGSPVAQTNPKKEVLSRTHYEPYGYVASGPTHKIGFTGHVNDPATGLVYMQQRYYDPFAGRMLSIDPVTSDTNTGDSFNRYDYANNNSYRYTDPDGRFSEQTCADLVGNCATYGSSSHQRNVDMQTGAAAGMLAGTAIGTALSGGCDYVSFGLCIPANPAIAAGSAAIGGIAGGTFGPPVLESSRVLARNIATTFGANKLKGQVSHHIVAENDVRAAKSRNVLASAGMDINSAFNGMNMSAQHHSALHTDLYHLSVQGALYGANSYTEVAARLTAIRGQIYMGIFPY